MAGCGQDRDLGTSPWSSRTTVGSGHLQASATTASGCTDVPAPSTSWPASTTSPKWSRLPYSSECSRSLPEEPAYNQSKGQRAAPQGDLSKQLGIGLTGTPRSHYFDPARDLNPAQEFESSISTASSSPRSASSFSRSSRGQQSRTSTRHVPWNTVSNRSEPLPHIQSRYQLIIAEHPTAARASTYGDRDRRVINPPPVLQLTLDDYDPTNSQDQKDLTWPYNIVHCTLWRTPELDSGISECVEVTAYDPKSRRREGGLMGSLVANPMIVDNSDEQAGGDPITSPKCFYIFHDLSCRTTGKYRLRFEMTHIGEEFLRKGATSPMVAYAWSNTFEVYSAKDFPGVRPSSELLKFLKNKGANVTIKKDPAEDYAPRKRARRAVQRISDEDMTEQLSL